MRRLLLVYYTSAWYPYSPYADADVSMRANCGCGCPIYADAPLMRIRTSGLFQTSTQTYTNAYPHTVQESSCRPFPHLWSRLHLMRLIGLASLAVCLEAVVLFVVVEDPLLSVVPPAVAPRRELVRGVVKVGGGVTSLFVVLRAGGKEMFSVWESTK